jgi:hypothetical protein
MGRGKNPEPVGRVLSCSSCKFCHEVIAPAQQVLYNRVQKRGDCGVPAPNTGALASTRLTKQGVGRNCL